MNSIFKGRLSGNERRYIEEVLSSEFRSSKATGMMGRFEAAFAERFGVKYAISFVNGTATMHAALEACGIGPGDEVIVPPLTMSATTFAVLQANATPVFADVDRRTYQIDPESIKERVTPRTKAIIPVSLYGLAPDLDEIHAIAIKHGLTVIEDNAECFLGRYKGRLVGSDSDCASYSFQSSKHLTSGEGGVLITDREDLADAVRRVQSLGYAGVSASKGKISKFDIQDPDYNRHVCMGWNYRMPELCCAVALAQLERIDELVAMRVEIAKMYAEVARGFQSWFTPQEVGADYECSYWTWVACLDIDHVSWRNFRDAFVANGGHGVYAAWKLTYLEPMFVDRALLGRERFIDAMRWSTYREGLCPNAEFLQPRLLQFKTGFWDVNIAEAQADALYKTLQQFA